MGSMAHKERFLRMYDREADAVYRFCLLRTSDREVALDLLQETFLHYWESLESNTAIQNDRAFLFTIARNGIIDWYRKKKTVSLDALSEETGLEVETFIGGVEEEIELTTEAKFLMDKVRMLTPTYQQVMYLRFVEGLGPKDIADILGLTENIVSVRLHRGIKQLRVLAGYEDESDA